MGRKITIDDSFSNVKKAIEAEINKRKLPPPKKSAAIVRPSIKGAGFWQKPDRKGAKWDSFARRVRSREQSIREIASRYLNAQADRVAAEIRKAPSLDMVNRWSILDKEDEARRYADSALKWYEATFRRAVNAGLASGKGELFEGEAKFSKWTPEQEKAIRKLMLESGTKISETTMQEVMDFLDFAESESMTVNEFSKYLRDNLTEKFNPMRARRIAVTESAKVENYGELEGYRESEFITLKGWLCARIETSRAGHVKADDDYSTEPIPLDEPFMVMVDMDGKNPRMEEMMHPGDPSKASAGNTINCLCTMFPQVQELTEV